MAGRRRVRGPEPRQHIAHHGPPQPVRAQGGDHPPEVRALARDAERLRQDGIR